MALFIGERYKSRTRTEAASGGTATLLFTVGGTDDEDEALRFGLPKTPIKFRALLRQSSTIKRKGNKLWDLDIKYGIQTATGAAQRQLEIGEVRFSWDTTGGTIHITHSRETTGKFAAAGINACDFKGAIGVNENNIEGVDIVVPSLQFTLTFRAPFALVNLDYVKTIHDLTGTTNDGPFFGFNESELLYIGGTGDESSTDSSITSHSFVGIPNESDIAVGSDITVTVKKGHEYMWVAYALEEDTVCNRTVKQPISAYTERVYRKANFLDLKIGT